MKIKDSIKSWLENSVDLTEKELVSDLVNIFNLDHKAALKTYRDWRKQYKAAGYKTIESKLTQEERVTLQVLDQYYKNYMERTQWWF